MAPLLGQNRSAASQIKKNQISRVKKKKTGTKTGRNHRFESFSQRIARLTVDPIRRGDERTRVRGEDDESYFIVAFDRWRDQNLSESFTDFARRVGPLCQSLPQVLLYQEDIINLLYEYLKKGNSLSLEPLLNLTTQLARDLGARFENYFKATVEIVSGLAATHESVEVIEWAFTCLAFLFKYLSRLLVLDLRPLYDLMSPFLGKERHKSFVCRFSAESMSFLIRKTASKYHNDVLPLSTIISHAFDDLSATQDATNKSRYQTGLVILFSEAIKGIQRSTHSNGGLIMEALLIHMDRLALQNTSAAFDMMTVIESIVIDVIHHTDTAGFAPVLNIFLRTDSSQTLLQIRHLARLLFVALGTRKGSRVNDWSAAADKILYLIDQTASINPDAKSKDINQILCAAAALTQYAPVTIAVTFGETLFERFERFSWLPHFLPFCSMVSKMDSGRFKTTLSSQIQRFVNRYWTAYEMQICSIDFVVAHTDRDAIAIPEKWSEKIIHHFRSLPAGEISPKYDARLSLSQGYLNLLHVASKDSALRATVAGDLFDLLKTLSGTVGYESSLYAFAFCSGLEFAADHISLHTQAELDIDTLRYAVQNFGQNVAFLNGLQKLFGKSQVPIEMQSMEVSKISEVLINNLASPSHQLRKASLRALSALYISGQSSEPEILLLAQSIEDSPPTAENVRGISLNIRRLASIYQDEHLDSWMQRAIPTFCFGILHRPLTPLWDDSCKTLSQISAYHGSEKLITDRAISWLEGISETNSFKSLSESDSDSPQAGESDEFLLSNLPDFQCSNLAYLDDLARACFTKTSSGSNELDQQNERVLSPEPLTSDTSRSKGLQVLASMPWAAERRSRELVPILLSRIVHPDSFESVKEHNQDIFSDDREATQSRWSRKDQKALLALFEQFVNPNALFQAKEVYEALMELLCSGDNEIQRSSLKALFAWKQPFLTTYKEHMLNFLDDARFREELTVFLDSEGPENIRTEHLIDLLPILLRLLYGRVITRTGLGGPRATQEAKRKAVFVAISRLGDQAIVQFINIALGPLQDSSRYFDSPPSSEENLPACDLMSVRKQAGMLRLFKDMIATLSSQLLHVVHPIVLAVTYCLLRSNHRRENQEAESSESKIESLQKLIRHDGLACLALLYAKLPSAQWMDTIESGLLNEFIGPRLDHFAVETAQGVSGLLKLFAVWSKSIETVHLLVEPQFTILLKVSTCLANASAKTEVKRFVLKEIIQPFIETTSQSKQPGSPTYLSNDLSHSLLERISKLLMSTPDKDILEAGVEAAVSLQPYIIEFEHAKTLVELILQLLSEPSKQVSPRIKGQLLELLLPLIANYNWVREEVLWVSTVKSVSKLFGFFTDGPNRLRVVSIFKTLSLQNEDLQEVLDVCEGLNSFSNSRLNEPNYEDREKSFQRLNEDLFSRLNAVQWLPVVYNLLYLVKDKDELSTRSNASLALRRFIDRSLVDSTEQRKGEDLQSILREAVLPAIQRGIKDTSEFVRAEYIGLLAETVRCGYVPMQDMSCLLGPDEESSFFTNIVHIQQHRRIRALQRLSSESLNLAPANISHVCIPLLNNFMDVKDGGDHNLASAATVTLEHMSSGLDWHRYRYLLQQKIQDPNILNSKAQIRILGALINALYSASQLSRASLNVDAAVVSTDATDAAKRSNNLSKTLPTETALHKSLSNSVLSKLMDQIHFQDEASIETRILVAIYVVKLILTFSEERVQELLPAVLIDVCNILKSKSQEARENTRKTLSEIASIIGPRYFGFIVKQLRTSLKRGSQLHVLSFTIHSLLTSVSSSFEAGSIDYCLRDLVDAVIDDTFGITGQDKEAAGYISSMKEVKKKGLGYNSVEMLAAMTNLPRVITLLNPISVQLERARPKVEKCDELLRRIREGLRKNENINSRDSLILVFEILKENEPSGLGKDEMNLKEQKMTVFALELLRRVLDKNENLKTRQNLTGFIPVFAGLASRKDEEIRVTLFRLIASIVKVPLPELDDYAGEFIKQARKTIENSASTNEALAQAALRLSAAFLRERPDAVIPQASFESDVAFILKRIKPDIQEPEHSGERERQIAAFQFVKALMGRGIIMTEIYEIMNAVREVMLTSQDAPIPELARSVYSRFILDYFPGQGKGLSKQLEFLTTNLQYEHPRGRQSVMEVMAFVLGKMSVEDIQPVLTSFFIPIVLVLIVDQNNHCRDAAEALLHKIFEQADTERIELFKSQMIKWQQPESNVLWRKASLQVWQVFFKEHPGSVKEASTVAREIRGIIESSAAEEKMPETTQDLLVGCLDLFICLSQEFPGITFSKANLATWAAISSHVASEDSDARGRAAELMSMYLTDFARTAARLAKPLRLPVTGSHGLQLATSNVIPLVSASMALLGSDADTPETIEKTVKNLTFIGRLCSSSIENIKTETAGLENESILFDLLDESSAILRADIDTSRPPGGKLACMRLVSALYKAVPVDQLKSHHQKILLPLQHITDTGEQIPASKHPDFKKVYEEMVALAREVVEVIREKIGPDAFVQEMTAVQRIIRERRADRKAKRALDVLAEPERVERQKRKKRFKDKEKRRDRNQMAASKRRGW